MFGIMLDHPLVRLVGIACTMAPSPDYPFASVTEVANASLKAKRANLVRAHEERDWRTVVILHERPYRFEALQELVWEHGVAGLWPVVRGVWEDTENARQYAPEWRDLWATDCSWRKCICTARSARSSEKCLASLRSGAA